MNTANASVRAFECTVPGFFEDGRDLVKSILSLTASKARYRCLVDLRDAGWDGVQFKHIHVRPMGPIHVAPFPIATLEAFAHTAKYRGVPFARIGMRVEVDGHAGTIVGSNDSANFDVLFNAGPHTGLTLNCHPNWMFKYFDRDGSVIAEFGN